VRALPRLTLRRTCRYLRRAKGSTGPGVAGLGELTGGAWIGGAGSDVRTWVRTLLYSTVHSAGVYTLLYSTVHSAGVCTLLYSTVHSAGVCTLLSECCI